LIGRFLWFVLLTLPTGVHAARGGSSGPCSIGRLGTELVAFQAADSRFSSACLLATVLLA
jgi:hypothetical protein